MIDLLIKNAMLLGGSNADDEGVKGTRTVDLTITGGVIEEVAPRIESSAGAGRPRETVDAKGRLVLPPFVDSHFHLDSVWTRVPNATGTLKEGIDNWYTYKQTRLTVEDVYERARAYCEHAFSMGIQAIRSHVDVCDPQLRGAEALVQLREDLRDTIDIQLVAFPQDGYFRNPEVAGLLRKALDMGVDVVGGIPHFEQTMELGSRSIQDLMELAAERGLLVDMHCDESDDPLSRHVETLTFHTSRLGMQGRVTASHVTSMAIMDPYYVSRKLIPLMVGAEISVIANPLINIHLGGHFHHPKHRAMAPIRELHGAGITVACAQDCNEDPWYPLGNADMLEVARMGAHIGHMMGLDQLRAMVEMVTTGPAKIMHLDRYGLEPGCRANMVILDAKDYMEALRTGPQRTAVIRDGVLRKDGPVLKD
jgi:cytosine/creatinine deaminase